MFDITENARVYPITRAIDRTGAVISASAWVNMENVEKAIWILSCGSLSSTSTFAVTLYVANDGSGTKSVAIATASCDMVLPHYYLNSSGDVWAKTTVTASTFNITSASNSKCYILEAKAEDMGQFLSTAVTYDATHVRLAAASPGANACLTACTCIVTGLRYGQDTPPVVTG